MRIGMRIGMRFGMRMDWIQNGYKIIFEKKIEK